MCKMRGFLLLLNLEWSWDINCGVGPTSLPTSGGFGGRGRDDLRSSSCSRSTVLGVYDPGCWRGISYPWASVVLVAWV